MPSEGLYPPPQNPSDQIWPMVKALGQGMMPEYLKPNEGPVLPPNAEGKMPSVEPMNALPWLGVDLLGNAPAGGAKAGAALMKGIMGGPLALTADKAMLSKAKDMAQSAKWGKDTFNETGWYKGVDGKWRFEIPDSGMRIIQPRKSAVPPKEGNIEDIVRHPALYEAYPQIKGYEGTIKQGSVEGAHYHPERGARGRIEIGGPNNASRFNTTAHELQHAVQHIEDFAPGADASLMPFHDYLAHAGEVEARNAGHRIQMWSGRQPWLGPPKEISPLLTQDMRSHSQIIPMDWYKKQASDPEIQNYVRALVNRNRGY